MNWGAKVVSTLLGAALLGAALTATIQSFQDGGAGNGPLAGGIAAGVGLALMIIPAYRK